MTILNMDDKFKQLQALLGQQVESEDPTAPFQCMDWAFKWCDILGIDRAALRHQYAFQVWKQPNDLTVQNFDFIPNTPNGVPQQGDIPIFDQNVSGVTGIAGHICVATGEGDSNSFKSLDQNWNGVQHVTEETHSYTGVIGWLRMKQDSQLQSQLDEKNKAYDELYATDQENLHTISQQKDVIANLNQIVNDRNANITTLNAEVQKKETEIQARDQELTILKPIATLVPALQAQLTTQKTLIAQGDEKIQGLRDEITKLTQSNAQLSNSSAWGIPKKALIQIFLKRLVGAK